MIIAQELEVFDDTPSRDLTFDQITTGQSVLQRVRLTPAMLEAFGQVANDRAPIHDDPDFAEASGFEAPIVQGLALTTRFSRLIGMYLPGERAVLESIEVKFRRPVHVGSELIYRAEVKRVFRPMRVVELGLTISIEGTHHVTGSCRCRVR